MAQKRRSARGASRQGVSKEEPGSALRWYGAGLLSGLFLSLMLYLATLPAERGETPEAPSAPESASGAELPEFEFWEELPKQAPEVQRAEPPAPRENVAGKQLLLQAGSFRDPEDADRQRAKLLLLGLDPRVEEARGDNGLWFRVVIGPFPNRTAMERVRSLTAQEDIDTLLVRRDPG